MDTTSLTGTPKWRQGWRRTHPTAYGLRRSLAIRVYPGAFTASSITSSAGRWASSAVRSGGVSTAMDVSDRLGSAGTSMACSRSAGVVLNGHAHSYERFTPVDPAGSPDPSTGIRQFVVGTGGKNHSATAATPPPISEASTWTRSGCSN